MALQLLGRGLWWSLLLLGGLMAASGGQERVGGSLMALGSAAAVLLAGAPSQNDGSDRFAPVAFRGTLTLALVLAMADAASFLWLGLANAIFTRHLAMILLVPPMVAGVVGLLRLRTWGLLVSLGANVLVATLALTGVLTSAGELRILFASTAIVQLLVPVPMLITIIRRRAPGPDRWVTFRAVGSRLVIVGIAGLALYTAFLNKMLFIR
jgi:hypothetical protein